MISIAEANYHRSEKIFFHFGRHYLPDSRQLFKYNYDRLPSTNCICRRKRNACLKMFPASVFDEVIAYI